MPLRRVIFDPLVVPAALVAAVVFVLSFYGLRDYGWRVAGLPTNLAWLVPIGVDVFSLLGLTATYRLRRAPWHVRSYAWAVFLVPVVLSIAGNISHAQARKLAWQGWAGAAAWPVLLALAAHLVIVVHRNVETTVACPDVSIIEPPALGVTSVPANEPELALEVTSPAADSEPVMPSDVPPKLPASAVEIAKLRARKPAATQAEIAKRTGVSVRTVARHWPVTTPNGKVTS